MKIRLEFGFRWDGGAIGGCRQYRRRAFRHVGLISDETPILLLFVSKTRRATHLLTGDSKAEATKTDAKLLALDSAYVETNKLMRGVLRVELDTLFPSWEALRSAILACGVPLPNVAVGYRDNNGFILRPHLLWTLADSICFTPAGNKSHQQAWRNALRGLTARLLRIGADPGGIANPDRHKNVLSPLWDRQIMAAEPYSIDIDRRENAQGFVALRPCLPSPQEAMKALRQATEARRTTGEASSADHGNPAVAAQSNGIFRHLAGFARSRVLAHRHQGHGSRSAFEAELTQEALRISPPGERARAAVLSCAQRVVGWTWDHYQPRARAKPPEKRQERLSAGAKAAAAVKGSSTLAAIVKAIRHLAASGDRPTQAKVAAELHRRSST
ncbi:MAG: hypothetical protein JO110_04000, partial [Acetobacteraceae bacterium]|nr:hypothetical protein [Acetobacteraceae bacterium]